MGERCRDGFTCFVFCGLRVSVGGDVCRGKYWIRMGLGAGQSLEYWGRDPG